MLPTELGQSITLGTTFPTLFETFPTRPTRCDVWLLVDNVYQKISSYLIINVQKHHTPIVNHISKLAQSSPCVWLAICEFLWPLVCMLFPENCISLSQSECRKSMFMFLLATVFTWYDSENCWFSLTWSTAMFFNENKRKRLHSNRVKFPEDLVGAPTWPPFLCLGAPTWRSWRHVETENSLDFEMTSYHIRKPVLSIPLTLGSNKLSIMTFLSKRVR